jgi:hypothetical protein
MGNADLRWFFSPTKDGISFGPVIEAHNVHLTFYEKDGYFCRHITCDRERIGRLKMRKEDFFKAIYEEYRSMLGLLDGYDLHDEAVVITDVGWRFFCDIMKEMIGIRVKGGGRLLINLNLNYLIENKEILERKARALGKLFRVGRVIEALQGQLRDKSLLSPDGRPIVVFDDRAYIFKRSLSELLEDVRASRPASIEDSFKELERSELRPFVRVADLLGIRLLFIELERRGLFERVFPSIHS